MFVVQVIPHHMLLQTCVYSKCLLRMWDLLLLRYSFHKYTTKQCLKIHESVKHSLGEIIEEEKRGYRATNYGTSYKQCTASIIKWPYLYGKVKQNISGSNEH